MSTVYRVYKVRFQWNGRHNEPWNMLAIVGIRQTKDDREKAAKLCSTLRLQRTDDNDNNNKDNNNYNNNDDDNCLNFGVNEHEHTLASTPRMVTDKRTERPADRRCQAMAA